MYRYASASTCAWRKQVGTDAELIMHARSQFELSDFDALPHISEMDSSSVVSVEVRTSIPFPLHYTTLHYIALYCITLHYITLHLHWIDPQRKHWFSDRIIISYVKLFLNN